MIITDPVVRGRLDVERNQCGAYLDVANAVVEGQDAVGPERTFALHTIALYRCVYNLYSILLGKEVYDGQDSISVEDRGDGLGSVGG